MPERPVNNLPPGSQPWAREIAGAIDAAQFDATRANMNNKNAFKTINATLENLSKQVLKLAEITNLLVEMSEVQYSEFTAGLTGFIGFTDSPLRPKVEITSSTGRIEISYGGTLNGGDCYFCYSIVSGATPIVTRANVLANPAQRVAISGGASFAPSGYRSMVLDVPKNELLTITLEMYADSNFAYFFGGSISARVVP